MSNKKQVKLEYPYDIKDPDSLFDMICVENYFRGSMDGQIPVEHSRKVFARIKELLSLPSTRTNKKA